MLGAGNVTAAAVSVAWHARAVRCSHAGVPQTEPSIWKYRHNDTYTDIFEISVQIFIGLLVRVVQPESLEQRQ